MKAHSSNRRYTHYSKGKKKELISWMQNRCIKCGRFLAMKQIKYCSNCSYPAHLEQIRIYEKSPKAKIKDKRYRQKLKRERYEM